MPDLDGKTAWVTGGGSGIGEAAAKALAARGANVLVTDINGDQAFRVVDEISVDEGASNKVQALAIDVTQEEDNHRAAATAKEKFGRLDCALINAAISIAPGVNILDYKLEDFRKVMAVNCEGVFLGIKAAANVMKDNGTHGAIVAMSSGGALRVYPGRCAYATSKNAVIGVAKAAAVDLLPFGIRVNVLAPGVVATDGFRRTMQSENKDPNVANLAKAAASPELIADAICFFLGDASGAATGQVLPLDSGLSVAMYNSALHEHYGILAKIVDRPAHPNRHNS